MPEPDRWTVESLHLDDPGHINSRMALAAYLVARVFCRAVPLGVCPTCVGKALSEVMRMGVQEDSPFAVPRDAGDLLDLDGPEDAERVCDLIAAWGNQRFTAARPVTVRVSAN